MTARITALAAATALLLAGCGSLSFDTGACGAAADILATAGVAASAAVDGDNAKLDAALEDIKAAAERMSESSVSAVAELGPELAQAAEDAKAAEEVDAGDALDVVKSLALAAVAACTGN